uniref:capsular polysaccharide export protein, LipB/KpsS family n=1 Tax=Flavobacterium sp. TaxID=239 RepID=UPI00404B1441
MLSNNHKISNERVIYCTCIEYPWVDIVEKLSVEHNFLPCYFLAWPDTTVHDFSQKIKKINDSCFYQSIYDAIKGLGYQQTEKHNVFDYDLMLKVAPYELIAIKMMDRFDPFLSNFTFTLRQEFFRELLINWLNIIDENKISLVILASFPHRVYDYVLYVACKLKNIKVVTFKNAPFGSCFYLIDDIDMAPEWLYDFQGSNPNNLSKSILDKISLVRFQNLQSVKHVTFPNVSRPFNGKFSSFKNVRISLLRFYLVKIINFLRYKFNSYFINEFSFQVNRHLLPKSSKFKRIYVKLYLIKRKIYLNKLKKNYLKKIEPINSYSNIVSFLLHYQPEETTSPLGNIYVDQLLVIKMLDKVLPNDIVIVVKEHPAQFYSKLESPESGRLSSFYDSVLEVSKRIKFVDLNSDTIELIDKSLFIATITGTVGWEAAIRGKLVCIFGTPWYLGLPNTFRIRTVEDLNFFYFDVFLKKQHSVDSFPDILKYHQNLQDNLKYGIVCNGYKNLTEITPEESVENIYQEIISFLSKD